MRVSLKGDRLCAGRPKGGWGIWVRQFKLVWMLAFAKLAAFAEEVFVAFESPETPEALLGVIEYLGRRY